MGIWHDLRHKPPYYKIVLAETTDKRLHLKLVYFTEDKRWASAVSSACSWQSCKKKPYNRVLRSSFHVKRWAYIEDILSL